VEDLTASLQQQERATSEAKILNLASALDCASVWRKRGLKLGFTNGCFDLLHPGHLAVLSQAKAACDKLIVGLNSDASTKRLKGDDRPIQTESARAAVIASLEIVDLVVIFKEDTPATLVEALRPEVFVKGSDYSLEQIPEAKVVQAYGGEIILAKLAHGHSTSATIARIVD
jgi:D-beta-D-heptose 7-phosphate kinase/D-beta-D-heptose 1-phosphate adenosyltransferase